MYLKFIENFKCSRLFEILQPGSTAWMTKSQKRETGVLISVI